MSNFSDLDTNFKVETKIKEEGICFHDVREEPFKIYGVFYDNGRFRRIPTEVAKTVNETVLALHSHSAGGRVRFKTDSPYIAIHAKMGSIVKMEHIPLTGSGGFDMYMGHGPERYIKTFVPPYDMTDGYESIFRCGSSAMREVTINLPTYSSVLELYIGLKEGAQILPPRPYAIEKPIVYYGSSITQGGCASRPGNTYQSVITRRLDADHINLGFSGSARGETTMAEYIAGLEMSAFVYDYDHNAPTLEHLQKTHEPMFKIIRQAHPDIPIVLMTRPEYKLSEEDPRLQTIKKTYENALAAGDKNVYFLDGTALMEMAGFDGTVDGVHANDLGFASMAKAVGDVLEKALKKTD